ncbi:helix-turn-helix transcriptional regulator, partial [Paenibacillus sepulcri]|nr:helix-turn-helix transcriptional regulator [Paenibacillus sepulcri]
VRMNSCQEAQQLVTCRVNDLRASHAPMEACVLEIHKVVLSLLNTVQELGSPPQTTALYNQINELYRYKTLDDIEAWFKQLVQSIMTAITENRAQFTNMQIMRAVEYIDTNYANEKISLQELCRHVLMSTSYFSLVFKQHTGETFVEYLTRVRMEKARELLQFTSLKFYEIADRIGYGDPNYFSILFKKHAGVSPREYRDRLAKERAG